MSKLGDQDNRPGFMADPRNGINESSDSLRLSLRVAPNVTAKALLMTRSEDEDLLEGGDTFAGSLKCYHAASVHSLADGDFAHLAAVVPGDDEFANFIAHGHGFDDRHTAGIAGVFATFAATAAIEGDAV